MLYNVHPDLLEKDKDIALKFYIERIEQSKDEESRLGYLRLLAGLEPFNKQQIAFLEAFKKKAQDKLILVILEEMIKGNDRPPATDLRFSETFAFLIGVIKGASEKEQRRAAASLHRYTPFDAYQEKVVRELKDKMKGSKTAKELEKVLELSEEQKRERESQP